VELVCVEEVGMDEMWFYVRNRGYLCWFWYAMDHQTGEVLAYVFGTRVSVVFWRCCFCCFCCLIFLGFMQVVIMCVKRFLDWIRLELV